MKTLIHLVPRAGVESEWKPSVRGVAEELRGHADGTELSVNVMLRVESDPFGRDTPYAATIEIKGGHVGPEPVESLLAELGARLGDFAHPDLCTCLLGEDVIFVPCDPTPIRYQYLMRRNAHFDHAGYLKRYREIHSQFGLATPGIEGYVQFHVNEAASRRLAAVSGLGIWGVDSVSELHLRSLEHFLAEVTKCSIAADAMADEQLFVDRPRSLDFCSSVEQQG